MKRIFVLQLAFGLVAAYFVFTLHGFNWSDFLNGLFEFGGSFMLMRNVIQLHRDKMLRGYHWWSTAFFSVWGWWNTFYYPHLGQWWSFTGGVFVVSVNTFWLAQMYYYRKN